MHVTDWNSQGLIVVVFSLPEPVLGNTVNGVKDTRALPEEKSSLCFSGTTWRGHSFHALPPQRSPYFASTLDQQTPFCITSENYFAKQLGRRTKVGGGGKACQLNFHPQTPYIYRKAPDAVVRKDVAARPRRHLSGCLGKKMLLGVESQPGHLHLLGSEAPPSNQLPPNATTTRSQGRGLWTRKTNTGRKKHEEAPQATPPSADEASARNDDASIQQPTLSRASEKGAGRAWKKAMTRRLEDGLGHVHRRRI